MEVSQVIILVLSLYCVKMAPPNRRPYPDVAVQPALQNARGPVAPDQQNNVQVPQHIQAQVQQNNPLQYNQIPNLQNQPQQAPVNQGINPNQGIQLPNQQNQPQQDPVNQGINQNQGIQLPNQQNQQQQAPINQGINQNQGNQLPNQQNQPQQAPINQGINPNQGNQLPNQQNQPQQVPINQGLNPNQGNQQNQPQQVPIHPVIDQKSEFKNNQQLQQMQIDKAAGAFNQQQNILNSPLKDLEVQAQPQNQERPLKIEPDNRNVGVGQPVQQRVEGVQVARPAVKSDNDVAPIQNVQAMNHAADVKIQTMKKGGKSHPVIKMDKLLPPDHIDGVRMEQDGHLNRDYKKEIFLGNHEEMDMATDEDKKRILTDIFHKVDTNKDSFISSPELELWIGKKVREHFAEHEQENSHIFNLLDTDKNGLLKWEEFHVQFLMALGHDEKVAIQHANDYESLPLEPSVKEKILRFKFRWNDADSEPVDDQLTPEEFRSFRHPEQSTKMMNRMITDIFENLDKNEDKTITEDEFCALPPGDVDSKFTNTDKMWQDERRKEFRKTIDLNNDGVATLDEIRNYVDPRNPKHAIMESRNLITLADYNNDDKISLTEVLNNVDLFFDSKMVDTERNFHDEF